MMKCNINIIYLVILFLFKAQLLFSQVENGIITYKIIVDSSYYKTFKGFEKDTESMRNEFSKLEYHLYFSNNFSKFTLLEDLKAEVEFNKNLRKAYSFVGKADFYKDNITKKKIRCLNFLGDDFIIELESKNTEWILTSQSKQIDKFKVFKATTTYQIENGNGRVFTRNVEAWFCPELPSRFGPNGFDGLPGLILELRDHFFTFYCSKIELNLSNPISISFPKKGIFMSEHEYNNFLTEKTNNFLTNFKNN